MLVIPAPGKGIKGSAKMIFRFTAASFHSHWQHHRPRSNTKASSLAHKLDTVNINCQDRMYFHEDAMRTGLSKMGLPRAFGAPDSPQQR